MKAFLKTHIEITNICNLKCSFCPPVKRAPKTMSVEDFERIIKQVAPLTNKICLHLMGEPLSHPNFFEIVQIAYKYQVPIELVTNGILLRRSDFEKLLNPIFHQINFSLHSFFDNHPHKDPTTYLSKIFDFTKLAFEKRPDLYLNYRLWNLQEIKGKDNKNLDMLMRIENEFNIDLNHQLNIKSKKSYLIKNRLYLHYDTEFEWPSLDSEIIHKNGTCHGLKSHFGILVDGSVVPCCLDKEAGIPLGNILATSLLDILSNPRTKLIRKGFDEGLLLENLCQRCSFIERFNKKPISNRSI